MNKEATSIRARISLTTISGRVAHVHHVIASILNQTERRFRLRLYLSEDPYLQDQGIKAIPPSLERLREDPRFEIHFVENTGPFRKLIPELASADSLDCPIITADDDVTYPQRWLELLLKAHQRRPDAVIGYRARLILCDRNGRLLPYSHYPLIGPFGSRLLPPCRSVLPTGKAGILYPHGSLHPDVMDKAFLEHCPKADDLWFKLHSVAAGRDAIAIYHPSVNLRIREIPEVADSGLYFSNLDSGSKINNDTQLRSGLDHLVRKGLIKEKTFCAPWDGRGAPLPLIADHAFARLVEWPIDAIRKRIKDTTR